MKKILKSILSPIANPVTSKVNRFHDLHKGETCYLIAGGVSLKYFDFQAFDNHVSMVMNHIPFHKDFDKLNAKYCFLIEPYWFFPFLKTVIPPRKWIRNRIQESYRELIKRNSDKEFFINLSNYPVISGKNITYLFNSIPNSDLAQHFYSKGINPFAGTVRASVFMAIYFGFENAYLLGYDYTHYPSRIHHWFENGNGVVGSIQYHEKAFFDIAKEFINLTTVTIEGGSQVLNSITYKELTGKEPIYKENTEIISRENLEVIGSRADYLIYKKK